MGDEYILTRVPRRWVPDRLWRIVSAWTPLAMLLSEHTDACECACHTTPGMRDCSFCGWKR